jgi:hypothetical protein
MKLCKDCKHCKPYNTGNKSYGTNSMCYHPCVAISEIVTGDVFGEDCRHLRYAGRCTPEGVLFEPKPTLLQKIKNLFVKEKT